MASAIPATTSTGQPVLILKEGTTQTRGKSVQSNNIMAAKLISQVVKSSLGPRGMDKMLVDSLGDVTITNDGAVILKEIDVQHPGAKMIVEISKTTDNEVGDGTTSAVVLAGALLEKAEELLDNGVHATIIVDGFKKASSQALKLLDQISQKVQPGDKNTLIKVAKTSMASKLVSGKSDLFADLAVDALLQIAEKEMKEKEETYRVDIDNVKVEKKAGGSIADTKLTKGIILDKEVVHSGMPKRVENAKIALVNSAFEIEKTEIDAKLNITNPEQMRGFLDEENAMLKAMVDKVVEAGANVVICQKGIDDIAQHYLAKAGILAVRRAKESDMTKLAKATGARLVSSLDALTSKDLGSAALTEERKIEEDKWVFIEGCKNPKAVTILVRAGSQRIVDEVERSLHDAIMVVKDVLEHPSIVSGGGAVEEELYSNLAEWSNTLSGREQMAALKFAEALESIPLTLAENAGFDPIDIQVELRAAHSAGKKWYGVDVLGKGVQDLYAKNIVEPTVVKEQIIKSATEVAVMILRVDDMIATAKSAAPPRPPPGGGMGGMGEY